MKRAADTAETIIDLTLSPGITYTLTEDDLNPYIDESQYNEDELEKVKEEIIWDNVAYKHSLLPQRIIPYNTFLYEASIAEILAEEYDSEEQLPKLLHTDTDVQEVPVAKKEVAMYYFTQVLPLEAGNIVYIPSADELLFMELKKQHRGDYSIAVEVYRNYTESKNYHLYQSARTRSAGKIGLAYATESTIFLSPNKSLAGASNSRSEMVHGKKEYRINWGEYLWKCNVFLHDSVLYAGYQPHVTSNKHYITAGSLHQSNKYQQVKIEDVAPGCLLQLYGGTGSNDSHNMVLSSFIERTPLNDDSGNERWTFIAIGAEAERAAESKRSHEVNPNHNEEDFYEVLDGTRAYIRFFQPVSERTNYV